MTLSPGFLSTDCILDLELSFNIRFPFLKLYSPESASLCFLFFLPLFFLSLVVHSLLPTKPLLRSFVHVYSSAFLLSQRDFVPTIFTTEPHAFSLLFWTRKITYSSFTYVVFYCTLSLRPETEVCST